MIDTDRFLVTGTVASIDEAMFPGRYEQFYGYWKRFGPIPKYEGLLADLRISSISNQFRMNSGPIDGTVQGNLILPRSRLSQWVRSAASNEAARAPANALPLWSIRDD